jgi:hypothetical protein
MVVFSYVVGVPALILVLLAQSRALPVPRVYRPRLPVFLGVIGLFALSSYAGDHHVTASAWAWVLGALAVGALGVGALRGLTMRVWPSNGWVVRLGTALTMALWLVSLLVAFAGDVGSGSSGAAGLLGASFLVYLALTIAAQYYVIHRRAEPLWAQLGPDAGRPLVMSFMQGPGVYFSTFRAGGPGGPGGPAAPGWGTAARGDDGDVIDAEVVDDDDEHHGPPELHAPR